MDNGLVNVCVRCQRGVCMRLHESVWMIAARVTLFTLFAQSGIEHRGGALIKSSIIIRENILWKFNIACSFGLSLSPSLSLPIVIISDNLLVLNHH